MEIANNILKYYLRDVYFITGTAYAGKSTMVKMLAERYDQLVSEPENQTIGIAHGDCVEDAEYLCSLLRRHRPPREIMTVMYEPVTGCHVGPGTLALFFYGSDGVRVESR